MKTVKMESVVYKRYKCVEETCKRCGKKRLIRLSRTKGKNGLCQKCNMTVINEEGAVKNCKKCGTYLTKENEVRYGRKNKRQFSLCKTCFKEQERQKRILVKQQAMALLGGKCACCGEDRIEFLTVDHINNDGKIHREGRRNFAGDKVYRWIIKNYPELDGYALQVLCWNCNEAKRNYGVCPHTKKG